MQLIKDVDFRPLDKLVVTFDKLRTYTTDVTVTEEAGVEDKAIEDGAEVPATGKLKVVKDKVKYNQQVAKIVALPKGETEFMVGDEVLTDLRACFPLDGYKDLYLLQRHNIIGVMLDSIVGSSN